MPKFQYASTVADELGITPEKMGEILGTSVTLRTHIYADAKAKLNEHLASEPTPASNGADVVTSRSSSKGAFAPTRLMHTPRLKLAPGDHAVLHLFETVLDGVAKAQSGQRETKTGNGGQIAIADVLRPERWMWMDLPEYQVRQEKGTLPVLHPRTIEELAEPLSRLSLVNHTCRICTEEMERPHYRGMLEHLLAGNVKLPFHPNTRNALKFPQAHKGCPAILIMMSEVELELANEPEGEAKEAARWIAYHERLRADGGRLLSDFMQSEHRPLSARVAKARFEAICANVKQQREALS